MAENNVRTLKVCSQQRSSKVTWNYTWNLTLLKSPGNLHLTLHLHYTFYSTIKNFSACCNTSRGIKLAASQADCLCSASSLAIKRHDLCCTTALHVDGQMQICLNFKYMKLMHWIKLLFPVAFATPYKLAKCRSENPLLKRHRTIKNSSKGLSFRRHPILVVGKFSLLSNSELQNSSATSELILERMFSQFLPGFKKFKNTYQSGIIENTSKKLTSTLDLKWSRENKWEDLVSWCCSF